MSRWDGAASATHQVTFTYAGTTYMSRVVLIDGYTTTADIPKILAMPHGWAPADVVVLTVSEPLPE